MKSAEYCCPHCGHDTHTVVDTRATRRLETVVIRRRRSCDKCKYRWTSYEVPEAIVKKTEALVQLRDRVHRALFDLDKG